MSNDDSEDYGVFIILLALGALFLIGVGAAALEPEKHTITLSGPIMVTAVDDCVHHWAHVSMEEKTYHLKKDDKLIVTAETTRGIMAVGKGGAYTHVQGWLSDGTKVNVPLNELREQEGWRTWRQGDN